MYHRHSRKWKHLYLRFGGGIELSSKVINSDAGEDEKLKLELVPITISHPKLHGKSYTSMYAAWKVARTDMKANKKGKLEKQEDKSDAAMLLESLVGGVLKGMNIS